MPRTLNLQRSLIVGLVYFLIDSVHSQHYGPEQKRWMQKTNYAHQNHEMFQVEAFPTIVPPTPTMQELVRSVGYPLEEHKVQTEDGYILTVFRIPYGKNGTESPRVPVLLQHGIFACSAAWVISEPRKGLGFVLADAGYDVWLSNSRGNAYSMKHTKYDPKTDAKEFYDFSFHEMGYYDLPAVIDYILNETEQAEITYVGHSQGTSLFLAMAATRPEYNSKVKVAAAMAPIAFLDEMRGTVPIFGAFSGLLGRFCKWFGIYHILPDSRLIHFVDTLPCEKTSPIKGACKYFLFALSGFDVNQFNQTLMPLIAGIGPSGGASTKDLIHYGQLSRNGGKFTMYDYGKSENRRRYGRDSPPEYDLSKITMPVHLHYSLNDWLVGVDDVKRLHDGLNHSAMFEVPYPSFNHLDFMWAKDVRTLLYDGLIKLLKTTRTGGS